MISFATAAASNLVKANFLDVIRSWHHLTGSTATVESARSPLSWRTRWATRSLPIPISGQQRSMKGGKRSPSLSFTSARNAAHISPACAHHRRPRHDACC